jgi:CubicO group peptidase (beta-lactamase class C family)
VLGNVVEIIHGADLETVFQEEIFGPLGMLDSYFYPPAKKLDRLADYYYPIPEHSGTEVNIEGMPFSAANEYFNGPRRYMAGGAGLVTTIVDYWRFCQMLSNGGVLDGTRLLARPTVDLMTQNSIGDKDIFLTELGDKMGLAVGIRTKRGQTGQLESNGSYGWAGAYHHLFWVDPSEQLISIIMTQRVPGKSQNLAEAFKVLAYQAIVD